MAQHAVPKGIGQRLFFRAQLTTLLSEVVSTPSGSQDSSPMLLPLQGAAAPDVGQAEDDDGEEDPHLHEAGRAEGSEDNGPGDQEHRLDVEEDEQDGDEVEMDAEALARAGADRDSALIGVEFPR